jgi:recombination protein RecA
MAKKNKEEKEVKVKTSDLTDLMSSLRKNFGDSAVISFDKTSSNTKVIPTGILSLDNAIGGGFPLHRMIEIYGSESTAKTSTALMVAVEVQKAGKAVLFLDYENAFDLEYARKLGVIVDDPDLFVFCQPGTAEEGLGILEESIRSGLIGLAIVDSVAAMTTQKEVDGEMGDSVMGVHAKLMSQACRKLVGPLNESGAMIIWINQTRQKIGIVYGDPTTTPGGNALKFYASIRIQTSKGELIKENDKVVGNKVKIKVVKNKVAAPFGTAEFPLYYGLGVDKTGDFFDVMTDTGIIKQAGAWFSFDNEKLGQGRDKSIDKLVSDPVLYSKIKAAYDESKETKEM